MTTRGIGLDRKWWTLIGVCTGTFMLLLDVTVVNVALPDIQQSLHASFSDLQWVIDAYALTLAAFLLTAGVLGDMFGRRGVYAVGLTIFSLSSLLCGLSSSSLMLILCRGVQGVGGAIMFATSLALIANAFSGPERGTAFGVYGAVLGGAVAIGPLIGGAITGGIGWRWIFFVNLPIGVGAIIVTVARMADSRDPAARRVDWIGFITFSTSLFMLVFALLQGNARGWSSPSIVGLLGGSGVLLAVFLVAEWRGSDPMLDLSLFRRPAMVGVSLASFTLSASIFAMFLYLTLYLQEVLGYGPFATGLRFLPITMLAFVVAPVAGKLTVRVHARYLLGLGLLLVALGCYLMTGVQADSAWTVLLPGFVVAGIGVGITNPVLASATVSVVPPERSGMSTGSSSTFRQVGIATGIAGLGAVFLSQIRPNTLDALGRTPIGQGVVARGGSRLDGIIAGGNVRQTAGTVGNTGARHALTAAYQAGYTATFNHLMAIATVVALVGSLGTLALVRQRDFVPSYAADAPGPTADLSGMDAAVPEAIVSHGQSPIPDPPATSRRPGAPRHRAAPAVPAHRLATSRRHTRRNTR
jgi:EmrB/QacA subfamily drug resistance transporter